MKCLKKHGEVIRVTDAEAKKIMATGRYEFAKKSEWKAADAEAHAARKAKNKTLEAAKQARIEEQKKMKL